MMQLSFDHLCHDSPNAPTQNSGSAIDWFAWADWSKISAAQAGSYLAVIPIAALAVAWLWLGDLPLHHPAQKLPSLAIPNSKICETMAA